MPRRQNGFGPGFGFGGFAGTEFGFPPKAHGYHPSINQFGSLTSRSLSEKLNIDSQWAMWRKGYEIYVRALYSRLMRQVSPDTEEYENRETRFEEAQLLSILYQGTDYPTYVKFNGFRYPTRNADVNTTYVAKREPLKVNPQTDPPTPAPINLGQILEVIKGEEQQKYGEVWVRGAPDPVRGPLLLQMIGERLTDGTDEATMKNLLVRNLDNNKDEPAIYYGQTAPENVRRNSTAPLEPTEVTIRIPKNSIDPNPNHFTNKVYMPNQGLTGPFVLPRDSVFDIEKDIDELIGKVVYVPDFFKSREIADLQATVWIEDDIYMASYVADAGAASEVFVLDPGISLLPPSMYDISTLPQIFAATNSQYTLTGTYIFRKSDYQRFFAPQYLTAEMVEDRVATASYSILPFIIQQAYIEGDNLVIESVPFNSEVLMHPRIESFGTLIFSSTSFVKRLPDEKYKYVLDTNINPYQDEVFVSGGQVEPATTYTCSCPSHSKSQLAMPQATQDQGQRKLNRQQRYPLPSVQSQDRFAGAGAQSAAGKINSWETEADRNSFRVCKHTIAAMFADNIKVIEPGQYPTVGGREVFERKLEDEIRSYDMEILESFERGGISLTEIVFALAQGLNLDNVETAYVVLNSN